MGKLINKRCIISKGDDAGHIALVLFELGKEYRVKIKGEYKNIPKDVCDFQAWRIQYDEINKCKNQLNKII